MNDIEIRALYRDLKDPAENLKTANRQRELAAEAISSIFQQMEGLRKENRRIAGEVVKIRRTDGAGDVSVNYTMTYANAATHKQVADLACAVFCGLMDEDLKRRGELSFDNHDWCKIWKDSEDEEVDRGGDPQP